MHPNLPTSCTRARCSAVHRATVVACMLLAAMSAAVLVGDGWPGRFPASVVAADSERQATVPYAGCDGRLPWTDDGRERCRLGADGVEPSLLVWGDRHAIAWAPAFDDLLDDAGIAGVLAVSTTCPPLSGFEDSPNPQCQRFNQEVIGWLHSPGSPRIVAMVAAWNRYALLDASAAGEADADAVTVANVVTLSRLLDQTVRQLRASGKKVWIIGPTPGAPSDARLRYAIAMTHGRRGPAVHSASYFPGDSYPFPRAVSALPAHRRVVVIDPSFWSSLPAGLDPHAGRRPAAFETHRPRKWAPGPSTVARPLQSAAPTPR